MTRTTALILALTPAAAAAASDPQATFDVPDVVLKPGESRTVTVRLSAEQAAAAPALKLPAYLWFGSGEAGMAAALTVEVNGTALTDAHHPTNRPRRFRMPNRSGEQAWPLYDAKARAWTLFYDNDVLPAGKGTRYHSPEVDDYVHVFPVGRLLRAGNNTIRLGNVSEEYKVIVMSHASHEREMKRAAERFKPVPHDRILPARRAFLAPSAEECRNRFLLAHRLLESVYNDDGSWAKGYSSWSALNRPRCTHPLVRWTARPVLAYLAAHAVDSGTIYGRRAREGLEWLLGEQTEAGAFKWYWTPAGSVDGNSLYDTGIAGRALVAGYERFKDKRYIEASTRAAKWAMGMPVSGNANYNLFTVWHLAAHYRATRDRAVLDAAVVRTLKTLKGQTGTGMWSDHHNQQMCYHAIITRGLVELLSVLPDDHPDRDRIEAATVRAINHVIVEQGQDGSLRKHPSGGSWTGYAAGAAFATSALIDARRRFGWKLDDAIAGLAAAPDGIDPAKRATWDSSLSIVIYWRARAWAWAVDAAGGEGADGRAAP